MIPKHFWCLLSPSGQNFAKPCDIPELQTVPLIRDVWFTPALIANPQLLNLQKKFMRSIKVFSSIMKFTAVSTRDPCPLWVAQQWSGGPPIPVAQSLFSSPYTAQIPPTEVETITTVRWGCEITRDFRSELGCCPLPAHSGRGGSSNSGFHRTTQRSFRCN